MSSLSQSPGRIAGIDFGTVRIGVAITDPDRTLASPLTTYVRRNPEADRQWFCALASQHEIRLFVVGLPVHWDGRESTSSQKAREFGQWLQKVTGVPVEFYDERMTTLEAEEHLRDSGLGRNKRKDRADKVAAQLLLAAYLEASRRGQKSPGPIEDSP